MSSQKSIDRLNTSKIVYPCFCCLSTTNETFFQVFTILLMLDGIIKLICLMILMAINFTLALMLPLLLILSFVIKVILVYRKYSQEGVYGTNLAYVFSFFIFAMFILLLASLLIASLLIVFMNHQVFSSFLGLDNSVLTCYLVLLLPLCIYMNFLSYTYFSVIQQERKENNMIIDVTEEQCLDLQEDESNN